MVRVLLEFHGYANPTAADGVLSASKACLELLKDQGLQFIVDADPDKASEEGLHTHATLRFGFAAKVLTFRTELSMSGPNSGIRNGDGTLNPTLQSIPGVEDAQVTADLLRGTYVGDLKHLRAL